MQMAKRSKAYKAAAEKIGAPQPTTTFNVIMGGPGRTYNIVLPFNKWSEVDGWMTVSVPQMLTKAFGEAEGMKILRAGAPTIERIETAVYRLLPDLSTRPRAFDQPPAYFHVIVTEVEPAMVPTFRSYLAKVREAQEKSSRAPAAIRRVAVVGQGNADEIAHRIQDLEFEKDLTALSQCLTATAGKEA
jgi:hypothetical protein